MTLTRRVILIRLTCNVQAQAKQRNGAEEWGAEKPDYYDALWGKQIMAEKEKYGAVSMREIMGGS